MGSEIFIELFIWNRPKGSSVQFIPGLLAHGETPQSIIEEYPYITEEDIRACLLFANEVLENNFFTQNIA